GPLSRLAGSFIRASPFTFPRASAPPTPCSPPPHYGVRSHAVPVEDVTEAPCAKKNGPDQFDASPGTKQNRFNVGRCCRYTRSFRQPRNGQISTFTLFVENTRPQSR